MYTFTEEHVCFHVIYLYLVLTSDPTGKGSIMYGSHTALKLAAARNYSL